MRKESVRQGTANYDMGRCLYKRNQSCLNRLLVGHPQPSDPSGEQQSDSRKGVEDRLVICIQREVNDLRESGEISLYPLL